MAEGEFALVRKHLEGVLDQTAEWVGDHDLYAMLVDAAAQQRDQVALGRYAPLAEETAARYEHTLYQGVADRAFGVARRLAREYGEAEARLEQALELFVGLGTGWQMGRTLFELGELAQARNDAAAAQDYFTRALAEFEKLGAAPDAARTQAALESLRVIDGKEAVGDSLPPVDNPRDV
jgi:tetratricopeptide (TPR) repeat protein